MMKSILSTAILLLFIISGFTQESSSFKNNHPNVHRIVVKEVLQTTSYTYILSEENSALQWIAIPKMAASPGEIYYFQGGMEMGEFKSKELNRTFSSILFLNGLISPEVIEGGGTALNISTQKANITKVTIEGPLDLAQGGISIDELYMNREEYASKTVKIRGKVTKFNAKIMSRNWIHLKDGTGSSDNLDITATSQEEVKVGDIVTLEGMITLDKDFGAGYFYSIIMENSRIVDPAK